AAHTSVIEGNPMSSSQPHNPSPRPRHAPLWIAAAMAAAVACGRGEGGQVAYVGGNLWDGSGGPPILDAVIVVADGRIQAAGPPDAVDVPRGATEGRLGGKGVI